MISNWNSPLRSSLWLRAGRRTLTWCTCPATTQKEEITSQGRLCKLKGTNLMEFVIFFQQQFVGLFFFAAGRRQDTVYLDVFSSKWSEKGVTETQRLLGINVLWTKHVYSPTSALCEGDGVIYRPLGLAIVFRFQWTHEGTFMPPASVWVSGGWGWRRQSELPLLPRAELSCRPCRSQQRPGWWRCGGNTQAHTAAICCHTFVLLTSTWSSG